MITLNNINYTVGKRHILKDINMNIKPDSLTILFGPSGVGKTSLLNIIGTLIKPDSGEVYLNNHDISKYSFDAKAKLRANTISYVLQSDGLLNDQSIEKNILIALAPTQIKYDLEKIKHLLSTLGINLDLKTKISDLSGGEKQRVALAIGLLKDGDIILCDEPTSSLDSNHEQLVMNILKNFAIRGKTVIIVSHNQNLQSFADDVYYLSSQGLSHHEK